MINLLLFVILALLLLVIIIWIIGIFLVNDFNLPSANIRKYKHTLVIFPHADDEVSHAAGLLHLQKRFSNKTTLVILTKGERGTPDAHLDNSLKPIRTKEAQIAAKIYGVTNLIQKDFGDNNLANKKKELSTYINEIIKNEKPDLVITYDLAGEYGHPDHMIVSEIVTYLVKNKYKKTQLWYATFPKLIYNMATLPTQMAKDPNFIKLRAPANLKLVIGFSVIQKIQALYAYKSQTQSMQKAIPHKIPPWFVFSMFICEYFNSAN